MTDLKLALRSIFRTPGFAIVTIISLALGIGANTTIFSLANEVLIKSLPVREPERLVLFSWASLENVSPQSLNGWSQHDSKTGENTSTSFSRLTFDTFRASSGELLSDVFAFAELYRASVVVDGQAEMLTDCQIVSGNYYSALGVNMIAGRSITPADDQPSAAPVVVISADYWRRRFGGDPEVIGRKISINNVLAEVVGVTQPGFPGTMQVGEVQDLTLPLSAYPLVAPDDTDAVEPWCWWMRIMGRMKPGVTFDQVQANLAGIFKESTKDALGSGNSRSGKPKTDLIRLRTESGAQGLQEARRLYSQSIWILLALVGLVLLVACANVANLLLARGAARQREIAVRLALGAGGVRILRQLLTESLILALAGAIAGFVFAWWARGALLALRPLSNSDLTLDLAIDWRVLLFTAGVAVLTGVLFGIAPALCAMRTNLNAGFQGGARTLGAGRSRLASVLMIVQVALSIVLLVGAGLFARTLTNLRNVDTGFNRRHLLLFTIDAMSGGMKREQIPDFYKNAAERFAALPGVESLAFSQMPVLSGGSWTSNAVIQGKPEDPEHPSFVLMNGVNPDFFSTYGMPILLGRAFTERDDAAAPKVAIVNQEFAKKHFGDESPIGRRFGLGEAENAADFEIVGVVRNARAVRLNEEPRPAAFLPYPQLRNARAANFAIRTAGDPTSLASSLRSAMREIDPTLPLFNFRTQEEQVAKMLSSQRMFAGLSSFLGLLALLLASVGLYGLMSYSVVRRTGEIGLRMALGALPGRVLLMILRESLILVSIGAIVGLGAAWGSSRLIQSRLFGVAAVDPLTYGSVLLVLLVVGAIASLLPARGASRVDPMVALRSE